MKALIVEDDGSVARYLMQAMTQAGYAVQVVGDCAAALEAARDGGFDLVLLEVMLPEMDGLIVCRRLRAAGMLTPVLILTARDTLEEKIEGLDSGADDYLVKPFQVAEMLARVRALLRRSAPAPPVLVVADLSLDPATRRAGRAGKTIALSATEYALLEYLMRNANRVLTRPQLLDHVWQYDFGGNDNVLDVYISYLRSKVDRGHATALIHTVRGVGYRMGIPDAS